MAVHETVPKVIPAKKTRPVWEDDILRELMHKQYRTNTPQERREADKATKLHRKALKDKFYARKADEINKAAECRQVEREFALAKTYSMHSKKPKMTIPVEKLTEHFREHFRATDLVEPPEIMNPEKFGLGDADFSIDQSAPTEVEVEVALKTFKNNKSAGTDKIPTEALKYQSSGSLISPLTTLLQMIWLLVALPNTWLCSSITCLFKKGLRSLASNYRALSVGANLSKILPRIILTRIEDAYENSLEESQFGFRKGRSTADGIYVVESILSKFDGTIVAVFVDLTAAYDRIDRLCLFKVLAFRTGAKELSELLYKMYQGTTAKICGSKVSFEILSGCRQGGLESPMLFNYFFDFVLKVCAREIDLAFPDGWGIDMKYRIPGECYDRKRDGRMSGKGAIKWILYADDLAAFCGSVGEAQLVMDIMHRVCSRFGLTISFRKTKTMVFGNQALAATKSILNIDGVELENVEDFCYLGHTISSRKEASFTDLRIASAVSKFNELSNVLRDGEVNIFTRRKILEACVRSRLCYATQAILPNAAERRSLLACWHGCLRKMIRGGYRRKSDSHNEFAMVYSNQDLQRIFHTQNLEHFIITHHLKYIAHICRRPASNYTKKLLFAVPTKPYIRDHWILIGKELGIDPSQARRVTQNKAEFIRLLETRFPPLKAASASEILAPVMCN